MTREQWTELELALFEFVKRAAREGATDAEVIALPMAAWVLTKS